MRVGGRVDIIIKLVNQAYRSQIQQNYHWLARTDWQHETDTSAAMACCSGLCTGKAHRTLRCYVPKYVVQKVHQVPSPSLVKTERHSIAMASLASGTASSDAKPWSSLPIE